jgi:hypothetical protein
MHLAETSVASRTSAIKSYLRFCLAYGHTPCLEDIGISDHVLAAYAIYLALSGNHKSVQAYMSTGCKYICESYGGVWKTLSERPVTYRTVRALDRMFGSPPKRKHPITVSMLTSMSVRMSTTTDVMEATIYACILVAFFGFLRKSSYTVKRSGDFDAGKHLSYKKLSKIEGRYMITLTHTKTVQLEDRHLEIWLPRLNNAICPCRAIDRMIALREAEWGPIKEDAPLFAISKLGNPLTSQRFETELKEKLSACGYDTAYLTPHSLRRGGTTFAFESGCSRACIKMQGDWLSDAYLVYMCFTNDIKRSTIQVMEAHICRLYL